jgi:FkbM family methyltransferase
MTADQQGGHDWRNGLVKFCRLRLGMKPLIDYIQRNNRLLGIRDLPIRTVFDVGANVGKKSRIYRRAFPAATIYCFEPAPEPYRKLTAWADSQGGKVKPFHLALGKAPGTSVLSYNLNHSGGSTLRTPGNHNREATTPIEVPVETLDRMAAQLILEDEILVKIDVEGLDLDVILGGMELLRRASAVIVEIALPTEPAEGPTFGNFLQVLGDLGYLYRGNLTCAYQSGMALNADAVFIKPPALRACSESSKAARL